jgi:hypothetical protein
MLNVEDCDDLTLKLRCNHFIFFVKYQQLSTKKRGHAPSTREKVGGKCFQIARNNMYMAM